MGYAEILCKSIKKINLDCSKLNIFIGDPNVGKSNILEALGMISSLLYYPYKTDNKIISKAFVRYENLSNLFYNENLKEEIEIKVDEFQLKLKAYEDKMKYYVSVLSSDFDEDDKKPIENKKLGNHQEIKLDFFDNNMGFPNMDLEKFLSSKKGKIPRIKMYKKLVTDKFSLKKLSFLVPPSGQNLLFLLNTNETLLNNLNDILEDFDLRIMLRTTEGKIECVRDIKGKLIALPLKSIAETFHQLFLLIGVIETNKSSVIVFEEPETHMFPKYSKYIAEIIARDQNKNQYFISTHNPYFLLSLIEKSPIQDISVFAVSYAEYETKVKKLNKEDIQNILQSEDPFFNLDKYIG